MENLNESNALEIFNLAEAYKSEALKRAAFEEIKRNVSEVSDHFYDSKHVNEIVNAKQHFEQLLQK